MKICLLTMAPLLARVAYTFPSIARHLHMRADHVDGRESFGENFARTSEDIVRRGAVPLSKKYPYNGAVNGLPSEGKGGYPVPAPGDTAHRFIAPGPNDIRGPCPGTNAMANHGFISRDGITTFDELLDGAQNSWNLGWDLAVFLAGLEVALSGDPLTQTVSIGHAFPSTVLGQPPQNGYFHHNGWESDGSMTYQDYYLGNYQVQMPSLFKEMTETVNPGGPANETVYDFKGMSKVRQRRYEDCINQNPHCFWGPFEFILYGAAVFNYEVMGNGTYKELTAIYGFDPITLKPQSHTFPAGYVTRSTPFFFAEAAEQVVAMYLQYPTIFGGNTGTVNSFNALNVPGTILQGKPLTADQLGAIGGGFVCLIKQAVFSLTPGLLNGLEISLDAWNFLEEKVSPAFVQFDC